ncbi:MAG: hypothetical protein ACK5Q5_16255 [Planctomycetaceae bacterium]
MSVDTQSDRLLPGAMVLRLSQHLEQQRLYWDQLSAVIHRQCILGPVEQPQALALAEADAEFATLAAESLRLSAELHELAVAVMPSWPHPSSSWRVLPIPRKDRAGIEEQFRQVRASVARAAGLLRGTMAAARIWNDVLQSAMAAIHGVQVAPVRYSSRGGLVASHGAHLLEARS